MKYNIAKQSAPKMPKLGKGTECIKILLFLASKASEACMNTSYRCFYQYFSRILVVRKINTPTHFEGSMWQNKSTKHAKRE